MKLGVQHPALIGSCKHDQRVRMPENIKVFRNFQQIVKLIFHKITLKRGIFTYHSGTIEAGVDIGFAGI